MTTDEHALQAYFRARPRVLIAFSGGVDSAVLALVAHRALGDDMLAVTGISPAVPERDRVQAVEFCQQHGIPHRLLETREFQDPNYLANPHNRCYFCKSELFRGLEQLRQELEWDVIAEGTNTSDLRGHRPGQQAAQEARVIAPYLDLSIDKDGVRAIARACDLSLAEKPATACLASRIPTGTAIDPAILRRVDQAEDFLRSLGLQQVRVRHHGELARIEVEPQEFARCLAAHAAIASALRDLGYRYVTLDLHGYRTGSTAGVMTSRTTTARDHGIATAS